MANRLVRYELGAGIGVAESSLPVVDVDSGRLVIGDSSPATSSTSMCAVAISNSGDIYVADSAQSVIYRVDESGTPFIFAGLYGATGNVDGDANTAKFGTPVALAVDRSGFVYVADNANGSVRRIDKNGNVGTLATGITSPVGVAVGSNGWVYVVDNVDHVVYQIKDGGAKLVLAGSTGVSGDVAGVSGGSRVYGTTARFNAPTAIACDRSGNVFVADAGNFKIKKIYADGWVVRYTGTTTGNVLGVAASSKFAAVNGIASDSTGNLLVLDIGNDKIKYVDRNGTVSMLSPTASTALAIAVSPYDIIYVVESSDTAPNNSSSSSSSTKVSLSSSSSSKSSKSVSSSSSTT